MASRGRPADAGDAPGGLWLENGDDSWIERIRQAEAPPEGGVLFAVGDYELVEEVSRGSQGVVFRARESSTGRTIALKRLIGGNESDT